VLDAALTVDKNARVALETLVTINKVILAGEVSCDKKLDYKEIVLKKIAQLGYTNPLFEFDLNSDIEVLVHQQSSDISLGVDNEGAGDQGMMFGYACNETPEFMPLPIMICHQLCQRMDELQTGELKYLRPDGKAEVSVKYKNGVPVEIEKIVLAKPFDLSLTANEVKNDLYNLAVVPILRKIGLNNLGLEKIIFNGTGQWEIGGPASDTGVTGRKIVVDTYGGMGRIGGGCFSGKDPTKVDRSAAYAARFLAKNIVANGFADRCEVQLAYVIGQRDPIVKSIETFGTEKENLEAIETFAWGLMDLSVKGIIEGFNLKRPIYQQTARYGHFGNNSYPWEKVIHK